MTDEFKDTLLSLYHGYTSVLGPYKRKDGREHIILNKSNVPNGTKGKLKTISYPKAIMEVYLGKILSENETVDHIDKNPLNNDINNLQVLDRRVHAKLDVRRRKPVFVKCMFCGKEFEATNNQLNRSATGFFCSEKMFW